MFSCTDELTPQEGVVYTIREIVHGLSTVAPGTSAMTTGFLLVEIVNTPKMYRVNLQNQTALKEKWWGCSKFRPLTQKPTDISIFTDMLITKRECLPA